MPRSRGWVYAPRKPKRVPASPALQAEAEARAKELIETVLKPRHIQPRPDDYQLNYVSDIWTKWYQSSLFYFCATYQCPGPNALSPTFESRFARMWHTGDGHFTLAYMRYTGEWIDLYTDQTLDECLERIRDEGHFYVL